VSYLLFHFVSLYRLWFNDSFYISSFFSSRICYLFPLFPCNTI
jgi:hypothetical protein